MAKTERTRKKTDGTTGSNAARRAAIAAQTAATAATPVTTDATRAKTVRKKKKLPGEVARAVRAALDKKAVDVVVLDLRHTPAFTDFFVLCSGTNARQVKAIADAVEETLRAAKVRPAHTEGYDRAEWVLMDFFNFIVHVFTPQTRAFYSLERLWGDAERIDVTDESASGL